MVVVVVVVVVAVAVGARACGEHDSDGADDWEKIDCRG